MEKEETETANARSSELRSRRQTKTKFQAIRRPGLGRRTKFSKQAGRPESREKSVMPGGETTQEPPEEIKSRGSLRTKEK